MQYKITLLLYNFEVDINWIKKTRTWKDAEFCIGVQLPYLLN